MKLTVERLRELGFSELPSGAWIKQTNRGHHVVEPSLVAAQPKKRIRQSSRPLMNQTEARYYALMVQRGYAGILAQAITLRLDPPFKSYRPDFFRIGKNGGWVFTEVKGLHRFRRAGIAKAALAAKTYPQFTFELAEWDGTEWKESVLSP